jgi:excisionase family DNA binding protein
MTLQLLTPEDVSKLLAVSVKGVHELCRSGRLDYVRVNGKERRFTEEMIQSFIEAQTVSRPEKQVDRTPHKPLPSYPRKGGEGKESTRVSEAGLLREEIKRLCQ